MSIFIKKPKIINNAKEKEEHINEVRAKLRELNIGYALLFRLCRKSSSTPTKEDDWKQVYSQRCHTFNIRKEYGTNIYMKKDSFVWVIPKEYFDFCQKLEERHQTILEELYNYSWFIIWDCLNSKNATFDENEEMYFFGFGSV